MRSSDDARLDGRTVKILPKPIQLISVILMLMAVPTVSACAAKAKGIRKEPVQIRVLISNPQRDSLTDRGLDELYGKTAASFHESNPGITVEFEYLGEKEDLLERLRRDDSPDIVQSPEYQPYGTVDMAELEGGLIDLLPMQQASAEPAVDADRLEMTLQDGRMPWLPFTFQPFVVIYDKDFFDEAGIPYPREDWTWEQYREISKRLRVGSSIAYTPETLQLLMAGLGKSMLSPDGETAVGYLDSPEAVQALRWLNGYLHENASGPGPAAGLGWKFATRQAGMEVGIYFAYTAYVTQFKERADRIGIAPLPHFQDGKRANFAIFRGYGMSAKSKHPQEAWEVMEYLTRAHKNFFRFGEYYLTPGSSGSKAIMLDKDPVRSVRDDEMIYAVPYPAFDGWRNEDLIHSFQMLIHAADEEIPDKLHELALKVDRERVRLQIEKSIRK